MISFQINDMSCGHCVRSIIQAVNDLDTTARLRFDLDRRRLDIEASLADAAQLGEVIRTAGYTPLAIQAAPVDSPAAATAPARRGCCCG